MESCCKRSLKHSKMAFAGPKPLMKGSELQGQSPLKSAYKVNNADFQGKRLRQISIGPGSRQPAGPFNRVRGSLSLPLPTPHSKRVRTMRFPESFKIPPNFDCIPRLATANMPNIIGSLCRVHRLFEYDRPLPALKPESSLQLKTLSLTL